ncbi:hypothetical protein GGR53DRAFT_321970 [Hypoxylon sp. FL1150]|nr:hypothetical protein GGR53DRAFT_321970 [Hypoxylon sp. FL1150]
MPRLAPWVKYRTEWKDIRAERSKGSILDRKTADESRLIPDPSSPPEVEQRFGWVPQQLAAGLGLSRVRFYSDQSLSPLFKLPIELRLAIWEYVVGGNEVTIVRTVAKIAHVVLPRDGERLELAEWDNWSFWGPVGREKRYKGGYALSAVDLLAMLRSCKRLYIEALPVLYGRNTFEFQTMESFYRFLLQSPTTGLQSIRSIKIAWNGFSYWQNFEKPVDPGTGEELDHDKSWREICSVISTMKSLRELRLHTWNEFVLRWQDTSRADMAKKILAPLEGLPEGVDLTFTCNNGHVTGNASQ